MPLVTVTQENFEETVKDGIAILDWWAAWCGPCRMFAPIFEEASKRHPEVKFGKIDTEDQQELAGGFGIRSIPTLMVFREGILLFAQPGAVGGPVLDELLTKVKELDMDDVRKQIAEAEAKEASEEQSG
jgi:thioredoxin 1